MDQKSGIKQACVAAGSQAALGRAVGVTEQAVCRWVKQGWVPAARARELEAIYGVSRLDLMNPKLRDLVDASVSL